MAIAVYFHPQSVSTTQYDDVIKRLDAAGASNPPGRLHHSGFGPPDQLMVYEIWDSPESFEKFGETLMPILGEVGIDSGQPEIMPLHNLIQ
jgi:hypothetical protein